MNIMGKTAIVVANVKFWHASDVPVWWGFSFQNSSQLLNETSGITAQMIRHLLMNERVYDIDNVALLLQYWILMR